MEREFEILIVEDDVELALTLKGILEEKGHPVAVAHNGQTALTLFREKIFDLALIDLRIPDMSGEELIAHLTALSPERSISSPLPTLRLRVRPKRLEKRTL